MGPTELMVCNRAVWCTAVMLLIAFATVSISAQERNDTLTTKTLEEVTIKGDRQSDLSRLPPIDGTRIWSGNKNEAIAVKNLDANITEKTARQIFAKIPGVFVYDVDGTGNQVNISTRGLDPHRGWEFNIRRMTPSQTPICMATLPAIIACRWKQ